MSKEVSMGYEVAVFKPYPFKIGQKIRVEGRVRKGDWEVVGVGEKSVTLKCPVSHKEFEWPTFCYLVDEETNAVWPQED